MIILILMNVSFYDLKFFVYLHPQSEYAQMVKLVDTPA